MRKTIAEYAKEYLEQNNFDAVGYGDSALLHEIAEYAGMKHNGWHTENNVLAALNRSELFEKRYFRGGFRSGKAICRSYIIRKEDKGDIFMKYLSKEEQFKEDLNSEEISRIKDDELRLIRHKYWLMLANAFADVETIPDERLEKVTDEIIKTERKELEEYKKRKGIS